VRHSCTEEGKEVIHIRKLSIIAPHKAFIDVGLYVQGRSVMYVTAPPGATTDYHFSPGSEPLAASYYDIDLTGSGGRLGWGAGVMFADAYKNFLGWLLFKDGERKSVEIINTHTGVVATFGGGSGATRPPAKEV
jgi:hypothetical protein